MNKLTECIIAEDGHMGFWYTGEKIVRCRDYKHSNTLETAPGVVVRCCYMNKLGIPRVVGDDGFCAWGERMEDGITG